MSFRNLVVARSPKFVTKLARSIRHLELLAASPLLVRKLVKGGSPIKLDWRPAKKARTAGRPWIVFPAATCIAI